MIHNVITARVTARPTTKRLRAVAFGRSFRATVVLPCPTTRNPAPAARRISLIGTLWPVGAPRSNGSVEKLYWVFAMQMGKWMKEGKLKSKEDIHVGIDKFYDTFCRLFSGEKVGKLVLDVREQ